MRFALVVTNLAGGGAEKALLKIAALLAERGHGVELILLEDLVEHAPPAGLRLHALGAPGGRAGKGFVGRRLAALRLRRLLARLAAAAPFDLVVSTLPYADQVARLAAAPRLVCRIANTLSAEVAALHARPVKAARRLARYRRLYDGQALVAVSEGVAEDLRGPLGLARARIAVIPNPFDFAAIRQAAERAEPDLPVGPFLLHVGRFAAQKRHDLLLDALALLPAAPPLVLLCERDPRLEAMIRARELTTRVRLAGFRANPYPWMRAARLLVLCSDHEGLPNVLIEALACGTPVVATDCPSGPREILAGALARQLVPTDDAAALAAAIAATLAAPPDPAAAELGRYAAPAVAAAWEALARSAP